MKKIVAVLRPFDLKQSVYVFEDGNKVAYNQTSLDDLNSIIFQLSQEFEVNQVDLTGPKQFSNGIKRRLEEAEIAKYSEHKLVINII